MKKFKIKVPGVKTLPLREAEPGMSLARSVSNRDGQLILSESQELSSSRLMKLKRFNVRRVAVREMQERWVTEPGRENLPESAEILKEKTVDESVEETDSAANATVKQLREILQEVEGKRRNQQEGDLADVRERIQQARGLEDKLNRLKRQVDEHEMDSSDRRQMLNALRGVTKRLDETFLNMDLPEELLFDSVDAVNEREQFRNELHETSGESIEIDSIEQADSTRGQPNFDPWFQKLQQGYQNTSKPGRRQWYQSRFRDLLELENTRDDLYENILTEIDNTELQTEMLNRLEGKAGPVEEMIERISDGTKEKQVRQILKSIDKFRDRYQQVHSKLETGPPDGESDRSDSGSAEGSRKQSKEKMEESERHQGNSGNEMEPILAQVQDAVSDEEVKGRLQAHRQRLQDLAQQRRSLEQTLVDQVDDEDNLSKILDALRGKRSPDPDVLSPLQLDAETAEELTHWIQEKTYGVRSALDQLDEIQQSEEFSQKGTEAIDDFSGRARLETLEKLKMFVRPEKINEEDSESPVPIQREQSLDEAIALQDSARIRDLSDLPENVITSLMNLFTIPESVQETKHTLLKQVKKVIDDVVYRASIDRDRLNQLVEQIHQLRSSVKRPFSNFIRSVDPTDVFLPHSFNNLYLSTWLAEESDRISVEASKVALSCITLDTGFAAIPDSMVFQSDEPSNRVMREYRKHPLFSQNFVGRAEGSSHEEAISVARHHERENGGGYPKRLDGPQRTAEDRFVQAVDKYTRFLENRLKQSPVPPDRALENMETSEQQFGDRELDAIRQTLGFYPNGTIVVLTDGRLAFVHQQSPDDPRNPHLLVLTDRSGNRHSSPPRLKLPRVSVNVKKLVRW